MTAREDSIRGRINLLKVGEKTDFARWDVKLVTIRSTASSITENLGKSFTVSVKEQPGKIVVTWLN